MSLNLGGFFTLADVEAYARDASRTVAECIRRHGQYRVLLDVSDCAIQAQDVIAAFIAHIQRQPVAERTAIVVGSSVIRMQVRRVMDRPNVAVFEDMTAAMAWVDEIIPRQAA